MSWDVSIVQDICPACSRGPSYIDVRNVTYNNSPIFNFLGIDLNKFNGMYTMEAEPLLHKAIHESYKPDVEKVLLELEPPNKWGGLADSRLFLEKLYRACLEHPKGKLKVQ